METPWADNQKPHNWKQSSLLNKLSTFVNKNYMVFHGTADDNVHYQNSMMLVKGLELMEIPFAQKSFPDQNHNIPEMYYYVFDSMERFWVEDCFDIA